MPDYTFYVEDYLGEDIPEKEFPRFIRRAGDELRRMREMYAVAPRQGLDPELAESMALCAVADAMYEFAQEDEARGITVLDRRENLLGRVTQRCRAEFTLRLCLPRTDADNAARLLDLQTWAAAENAAGRGPVLGNAGREVLRAEQGRMERADAGGTAVYTVRLQAEYTQVYTEETT